MQNWLFSVILPLVAIALFLYQKRPLNFANLTKTLTNSAIFLFIYILLLYFLQRENYLESDFWSIYTLIFFFIPYIILVLVLNIILRRKR